ncbi:GNAT family N-acetyltransferase [Haliea sp. E1-2-M8]|uniref:GNAT family N-acetyltransferase n=1 Tax=Haliea sp. E1-2-M8 TaxID=3064706 RepID=UPI0027170279|nr:GNAT family N-acetyltransferase [Haliea sp. E1-2-M8]MDO8862170.1 GNAT family N-acetyltransferase [Haliea sp. E1-2-M8]
MTPAAPAIRPGLLADAYRMARLDAASSPWPWSEAQYLRCCTPVADNRERALLLETDNELQGLVVFARELDDGSIYNIVVASSARRRGYGVLLLEAAIEALVTTGARRCLLEVRKSNTGARRLYASCGFHVDGTRRNYYPLPPGREDAILMSLDL